MIMVLKVRGLKDINSF